MFPLKNLARKGLILYHSEAADAQCPVSVYRDYLSRYKIFIIKIR